MLEAYLGAIFVDSGFDFTMIEAFFEKHILSFFHDMSIYDTFANRHPTVKTHFHCSLLLTHHGSLKLICDRRIFIVN
jgi:endoribonuclease Dicer